jgi:hybrid cluster-associated redox disulfide protein
MRSENRCLAICAETYYNEAQTKRRRKYLMATKITKDMTIGEILQINQGLAPVLMAGGMHCVGCPSSQMETLEEASMVHGIETDLLLTRLNAYLEALEK